MIDNLRDLVALSEGCRLQAYQDVMGIWTCGYGHTGVAIGRNTVWDQETADTVFEADLHIAQNAASGVLGLDEWSKLDIVRQAALTDMCFNLGSRGLSRFVKMLAAVRAGDWQEAHDQALASEWAGQAPGLAVRARRDAGMLLTGEWPTA